MPFSRGLMRMGPPAPSTVWYASTVSPPAASEGSRPHHVEDARVRAGPRPSPRRRAKGRAGAFRGSRRIADARREGALPRAAHLGAGPRRLVPGVLASAPSRQGADPHARLGFNLRFIQCPVPAAVGSWVSLTPRKYAVHLRGAQAVDRAARRARANGPGGLLLHSGDHARRQPDADSHLAWLRVPQSLLARSHRRESPDRRSLAAARRAGSRRDVHARGGGGGALRLRQREIGAPGCGATFSHLHGRRDQRGLPAVRRRRRLSPSRGLGRARMGLAEPRPPRAPLVLGTGRNALARALVRS